jgi:hypothetical protein
MVTFERVLVVVLRLAAAMLLAATVPAVMPFAWMEIIHRRIGLGDLPNATIVHYLTRSASALYALQGAIDLFISFDVRRYLPLVLFQGWLAVVFGAAMLVMDAAVGMPLWWTCAEGPFVMALGIVFVRLSAKARR